MDSSKEPLKNLLPAKENITILVGPEGDFTETELMHALENGWKPVSLGASRLRTETAGVVACHTVNLIKS